MRRCRSRGRQSWTCSFWARPDGSRRPRSPRRPGCWSSIPAPPVACRRSSPGWRIFGVRPGDLHGVLLTHIHLDHAGAARHAGPPVSAREGLRARARRAAPGRSGKAPGERHTPLWRPDGPAVGRVRGRACGQPGGARRRRRAGLRRRRVRRGLHGGSRVTPRLLPRPALGRGLRGRYGRHPCRPEPVRAAAHAAAGHRRARVAGEPREGARMGAVGGVRHALRPVS